MLLAFALAVLSPAAPDPAAGLESYAESAMRDWKIPGMAMVIVRDDRVVLERGFGTKKLGTQAAVGAHTVFSIGSCSKAFTSALVAGMVGEKKLGWDDRVIDHLPSFAVADPNVTRELTIRDLLNHRSGIGAIGHIDLLWYGSDYSREEILRRLRFEAPLAPFRRGFAYSNFTFLAAGELAARVLGTSWDQAIQQRLFLPLGMKESSTKLEAIASAKDAAFPHDEIDGELRVIPRRSIDNMGPGGSINSTAADLGRWLRFQLGAGMIDGKRVADAAALLETRAPQTVIPLGERSKRLTPHIHFRTYGLGWNSFDYGGRKVDFHPGGIDGFSALVLLVPEERLGLALLANRGEVMIGYAIAYRMLDALAGFPERDWSRILLDEARADKEKFARAEAETEAARVANTKPSRALAEYAGIYSSALYGDVSVTLEKDQLVLKLNRSWTGDLQHRHFDTFRVVWRDRYFGKSLANFTLDIDGKPERLRIETDGSPIELVRK